MYTYVEIVAVKLTVHIDCDYDLQILCTYTVYYYNCGLEMFCTHTYVVIVAVKIGVHIHCNWCHQVVYCNSGRKILFTNTMYIIIVGFKFRVQVQYNIVTFKFWINICGNCVLHIICSHASLLSPWTSFYTSLVIAMILD